MADAKHTIPLCMLAAGVFAAMPSVAASIHKCKNAEGEMVYQEKPCAKTMQSISAWGSSSDVETDPDSPEAAGKELVIGQGRDGHYYIDGSVNDNFLNFLVDTGATFVALPLSTATGAGLTCEAKGMMSTGNGNTQVCSTTIRKLKFGSFMLRGVQAMIVPNLSQPLLGMNVLKRFHVEQDNGAMHLSRKY